MTHETSLTLTLEQVEQEYRLSGAALISQNGHIVLEKAYGFASSQLNVPNIVETKFHIASVTQDVYRDGHTGTF